MLKPLILDEWEYIESPTQKIVWGFSFLIDLGYYQSIEECLDFKFYDLFTTFNSNDHLCILKTFELDLNFKTYDKLFSQNKPFILKTRIKDLSLQHDPCIFYKTNLHEFYHGQQYVKTSQETFKDIKKLLTLME